MRPLLPALALLLVVAPCVSAHGFVSRVIIDGTEYEGNIPSDYKGASPIRMISTIDPVKGANNSNINCGQDAELAEIVAPASPGSNVTFQWVGGSTGDSNWPHNTGPLMTYMASCGDVSCTEFNGSSAEWFKIDELGLYGEDKWYQAYIMDGDSYTVTLPENIEPGGYLIRHEIIALQLAVSIGGAEFYPSCTQVQISGDGTGTPDSADTCTFPGGYSDDDPGIYVPDIYDSDLDYIFPGPNISNLAYPGDGEITSPLTSTVAFVSGSGTVTATGTASAGVVVTVTGAGGSVATGSDADSGTGATGTGAAEATATASAASDENSGSASVCRLKPSTSSTGSSTTLTRRFHDNVMRRMRRGRS